MLSALINAIVSIGWGFYDIFKFNSEGDRYDKWASDASTKTPSQGILAYWFVVFNTWNQFFIIL
jgi:hypothetical protein